MLFTHSSSIHPSKSLVPFLVPVPTKVRHLGSRSQEPEPPDSTLKLDALTKLEMTSSQTAQSLHTTYHTALWSNLVNRCKPNSNQETMIAFNLAAETSHLFAEFMSNQIGTAFTCRVLR